MNKHQRVDDVVYGAPSTAHHVIYVSDLTGASANLGGEAYITTHPSRRHLCIQPHGRRFTPTAKTTARKLHGHASKAHDRYTAHEAREFAMCPATVPPLSSVKALAFDVFGTTVDWRSSVTEELTLRAYRKRSSNPSPALKDRLDSLDQDDWARFAQAWRDTYVHFVRSFNPGQDVWKTIDEHHRDSLVQLLGTWGLEGLYTDAEVDSLSLVWHRLAPWPDTVDGLAKLRDSGKLVLATLSNGNMDLVRDLNDFGGLGFHRLFCAETFRAYKPRPETYLGAARDMGLEPGQVAMVACHMGDLEAAKACGLRTIYVERPREEAWDKDGEEFVAARNWVDLWIGEEEGGFVTMADKLLDIL